MEEDIREWIGRMPKAEIHVHLEGTIGPTTLVALAERHGRSHALPSLEPAGVRRWMEFTSFPDFVDKYVLIASLLRSVDDFRMIVEACGRDMAEQGILYREITVTPFIHTDVLDKGLSIDDVMEGLEAGRLTAKDKYGVEMRWVFDIPRNASFRSGDIDSYDPFPAEQTLKYALQAVDHACVGFGLGGDEVGAPPEPFAHAFTAAKDAGLASAPHAGETAGAQSVWGAVRDLHADRIGHGVRAIEDPVLLTFLRDHQIPLEVSLSSNICLHVYPSIESHPFVHLDRMGLLLTINSDDPPLFNTTLTNEYFLAHQVLGYDKVDLARFARQAFTVAAVEEPVKAKLLAEFDHWAKSDVTLD